MYSREIIFSPACPYPPKKKTSLLAYGDIDTCGISVSYTHLFPSMEHLQQLVSLFALVFVDFQTNFSVCFADGQPIHIFKGK